MREQVKQLAKDVNLDETLTVECPYCKRDWENQGKPQHWRPSRSFSMTRERLGVLYHCFRASCGKSGFLPDISLQHGDPPERSKFKSREYSFDLFPVTGELLESLLEKGFTKEEINAYIRYNKIRDVLVYPISSYNGYNVGVVDRDYTGTRIPKAISYWFNDVPRLHFVRPVPSRVGRIIVTEDIPSAIKAARHLPSCALLGSHISDGQARHLRELTDNVILALDNDATAKAIKLQKRYGFYFRNFSVLPLSNKDIKDMDEDELEETLGEYSG